MANQFSPIRTDDTTLARVQDAIARFLNPLLRLTVKDRLSLNGSGVESNQECWADLSSSPVAGAGAAALTSQPFPVLNRIKKSPARITRSTDSASSSLPLSRRRPLTEPP